MIVSMRRLNFICDHAGCNARAVFELHSREPATNDRLLALDRVQHFCMKHTPDHAKDWWDWMATP